MEVASQKRSRSVSNSCVTSGCTLRPDGKAVSSTASAPPTWRASEALMRSTASASSWRDSVSTVSLPARQDSAPIISSSASTSPT